MSRAVDVAVRHIPGADHAGIVIEFAGHRPFTIAHTDDRVRTIDDAQFECGSGTNQLAVSTEHTVQVNLDDMGRLWPDVAISAYECGVDRILSAPLRRCNHAVGSLNLYTDATTPISVAATCAALAAIVTYLEAGLDDHSRHIDRVMRVDGPRTAVDTNSTYEQALAVIAASTPCSVADAIHALAAEARESSTSIMDTSARILGSHRLH